MGSHSRPLSVASDYLIIVMFNVQEMVQIIFKIEYESCLDFISFPSLTALATGIRNLVVLLYKH